MQRHKLTFLLLQTQRGSRSYSKNKDAKDISAVYRYPIMRHTVLNDGVTPPELPALND